MTRIGGSKTNIGSFLARSEEKHSPIQWMVAVMVQATFSLVDYPVVKQCFLMMLQYLIRITKMWVPEGQLVGYSSF